MHTGDRGFDPLGLAKPQEYLQFDVDQLDQNKNVNKAGNLVGQFTPGVKSNNDSLAPYDDVFGLDRFRETELIHGRWAMLATLGVLVGEASTGVSWSVPPSVFTAIHQNSHLSMFNTIFYVYSYLSDSKLTDLLRSLSSDSKLTDLLRSVSSVVSSAITGTASSVIMKLVCLTPSQSCLAQSASEVLARCML